MCEFKKGDVVICVDASGAAYLQRGKEYTITKVHDSGDIAVDDLNEVGWLTSRFELKQQSSSQQTKQATKRIAPSCVEDWHKAVGMYYMDGKVKEFKFVTTEHEVAVCFIGPYNNAIFKGGFDIDIELEVLVTTKRIPFDPKRKDAKVFHGELEVKEWHVFSNNIVAGVREYTLGVCIFNCTDLEMEIEE